MTLEYSASEYHIGVGDMLELALKESNHPRQRELIREAMQYEDVVA